MQHQGQSAELPARGWPRGLRPALGADSSHPGCSGSAPRPPLPWTATLALLTWPTVPPLPGSPCSGLPKTAESRFRGTGGSAQHPTAGSMAGEGHGGPLVLGDRELPAGMALRRHWGHRSPFQSTAVDWAPQASGTMTSCSLTGESHAWGQSPLGRRPWPASSAPSGPQGCTEPPSTAVSCRDQGVSSTTVCDL